MLIQTLIAQSPGQNQGRQIAQFGGGLAPEGGSGGLVGSISGDDPLSSAEIIISQIVGFLTVLGAIIFIFMFLIGALNWITAGGDSSKVEKARQSIVNGVIGLVVMVAAYAIVGLIGTIVGIDILNPAEQIRTIFSISQ